MASEVDYSLSILSLAYLAFPEIDKGRGDDEIEMDFKNGIHAFYDYASACWAMHLQACVPKTEDGNRLSDLFETLFPFIGLHWASTTKPLKVSAKVQASLANLKAKISSQEYDSVSQAIEWSRKQLGSRCEAPSREEALDLWLVTSKTRRVFEDLRCRSGSDLEIQELCQFYGNNWFKCPRVSCHFYHEGFSTAEKRKSHVDRHERPFLCIFDGCQMQVFGCSTADELRKHVIDWHGIDAYDGQEYPPPPKAQKPSTAKHPAKFKCPLCDTRFTRKANLQSHLRVHENIKPYTCSVCGEAFTRKSDCDRHEKGHGNKKFTCFGRLDDESAWGCRSSFSRPDKLADHYLSKTGQKCIRPLLLQRLRQEKGEVDVGEAMLANELSTNADALLAAGKLLPCFSDFLQLCGLDKSAIA